MTCSERDQDLVLLAHGALPWGQTLRTQLHLRVCPACRTRHAQLAHVSTLLAAEIRDPQMPPWSRPQALARSASRPSSWKAALVLTALVIVLGLSLLTYRHLASPATRGASGLAAPAPGGCRPDLPNSRCR